MSDFIEMRQIVTMVLRRWRLIVACVILGTGLGFLFSRSQYPVYEATSSVLVGRSIQGVNLSNNDIQVGEHLASTYATLGRRQPVLEGAVNELGLDMSWQQLRGQVQISQVDDTQLLEISVESTSPAVARLLADEIARQMLLLGPANTESAEEIESRRFLESRLESLRQRVENGQQRIEELEAEITEMTSTAAIGTRQSEIDTLEQMITNWESNYAQLSALLDSGDVDVNSLSLMEAAEVNPNPVRPRTELNMMLGGMLGLLLALGFTLVREYADDTVRTTDDLERDLGLTPLGAVGRIVGEGDGYQDKLLSTQGPFSPVAEAFNMIRSNIRFLSGGKEPGVVLVTSARVGEGKSLTVANLALAMAKHGVPTVVVDADLRRPTQHKIFGVGNETGLTEWLESDEPEPEIEDYVKQLGEGKPHLVTSGESPTNPSKLLGSEAMTLVLTRLLEDYNVVIMDGPPILTAADAAIMSSMADAVVLVAQSGRTTRKEGQRAVTGLEHAGAKVLGAVLNRVSSELQPYGYMPYGPDGEEADEHHFSYKRRLRNSYSRVGELVRGVRTASNGQHDAESVSDMED